MKENNHNFIYFINETHYLKELSKQNNHKLLIEKLDNRRNNFYLKFCIYLISFIILYNSFIFLFSFKSKPSLYINSIIILLSFFHYYTFNKVMINFSNSYNFFVELCQTIVQYDNIIKNKIKIKKYIKSIEEELNDSLTYMTNTIKNTISEKSKNANDTKDKNATELFDEYQKLKANLFKYIFKEYEREFMNKQMYINNYINYIYNYNNSICSKMKFISNELNKNILQLNEEKINYDSLLKEYEKYINNNIIKIEDIKKDELKNKIYNLLLSNYKLNENFIELIKEIDLNKNNYEKINKIIDIIIEKKQLSISLLEQFKIVKNKEENKIINNIDNKNKIFQDKNNIDNDNISFYDINLNNINIHKNKQNKNNDIITNKKVNNNKNNEIYDIMDEEEKIKDLKSSFIDELNNYCKKVRGLNKEISENKNENHKKEENDNINNFFKEEPDNNNSKTKLDFAKSLTLALGKNKNFKLNFIGDEEN